MDDTDRSILDCLQINAAMPVAEIAKRVNLSTTPCWRRIQKLKDSGVVQREVVILDRDKLNVGLTGFVAIRTNQHNPEWAGKFAEAVVDIPEIVECYRMSGEMDYLLKIVIPDLKAYDNVYNELIKHIEMFDVSASFAMEVMKYSTALPLHYL